MPLHMMHVLIGRDQHLHVCCLLLPPRQRQRHQYVCAFYCIFTVHVLCMRYAWSHAVFRSMLMWYMLSLAWADLVVDVQHLSPAHRKSPIFSFSCFSISMLSVCFSSSLKTSLPILLSSILATKIHVERARDNVAFQFYHTLCVTSWLWCDDLCICIYHSFLCNFEIYFELEHNTELPPYIYTYAYIHAYIHTYIH